MLILDPTTSCRSIVEWKSGKLARCQGIDLTKNALATCSQIDHASLCIQDLKIDEIRNTAFDILIDDVIDPFFLSPYPLDNSICILYLKITPVIRMFRMPWQMGSCLTELLLSWCYSEWNIPKLFKDRTRTSILFFWSIS